MRKPECSVCGVTDAVLMVFAGCIKRLDGKILPLMEPVAYCKPCCFTAGFSEELNPGRDLRAEAAAALTGALKCAEELRAAGRKWDALDRVMDVGCDWFGSMGRLSGMLGGGRITRGDEAFLGASDALEVADVSKINLTLLIGLMTGLFAHSERIPSWRGFTDRVKLHYKDRENMGGLFGGLWGYQGEPDTQGGKP